MFLTFLKNRMTVSSSSRFTQAAWMSPPNMSMTMVLFPSLEQKLRSLANVVPGVELEAEIIVDATGSSLMLREAQKVGVQDSDEVYTVIPVRVKMLPGHESGTIAVTSIVSGTRCGDVTIRFAEGGSLARDSVDP